MDWHIAPDAPIYAQLAKQIRLGIVSGEYVPGERLPPVRELALSAGVNPNTMQRALTELEREGLVFPQRTAGRFVTEDAALIAAARETLAREQTAGYLSAMQALGCGIAEIRGLIDELTEEKEEKDAEF